MKKLTFIRHGKSSWEYSVGDRERPLKSRGITDASLVATQIKSSYLELDMVFSSPANRAHSTCQIFLKELNIASEKFKIIEDLYDFGGSNVLKFIHDLSDDLDSVMLFGHNHAFTDLVNRLGDRYIDNLPTAGLVSIGFQIEEWKYAKHGTTDHIIFPRDLK
ncbi:histidine phosphatase family protein [Winogradskyella maritima]|uniref:SixA phosphatase family protein n=1 Tax=Winogradskyella maritima TaxID=1517766 RepID=A0ABV8AJ11_9FLAO|nr:histidine phosphatase family protein [Winogradskyella maritima]